MLSEQARCTDFCAVIGYGNGQYGAILPARIVLFPYNNSFIAQACTVKIAGYLFWLFMDLDSVLVFKHAELDQYSAICFFVLDQ